MGIESGVRVGRRRQRRAAGAVAVLLLVLGACSDDGGDVVDAGGSTTTTAAPADDTTTSTTTAAQPAQDLALSKAGLGPLQLGMSKADAIATGLLGDFSPGCELQMPRPEGGQLVAPYEGFAEFTEGELTAITLSGGAATDPGGVRPGDQVDAATAAFEAAGLTVVLDKGSEEVFGVWFLNVTDAGGADVFGTTVDPADGTLGPISVPYLQTCE